MIPIVREFFRGLRERRELDAIIPELLTAMGYEVISRPMIGTRQYGADVAAIGPDDDRIRKLFLFVIKRGDLTREEWEGGPQTVRPSDRQTVRPSDRRSLMCAMPTCAISRPNTKRCPL